MTTATALVALLLALAGAATAQKTPVELGKVGWRRDYAAARAEAKKRKRPLLLLFQEVPG